MRSKSAWRRELDRRSRLRGIRAGEREASRARRRASRHVDPVAAVLRERRERRAAFVRDFYRRRYSRAPKTVAVVGDFGIECAGDVDPFLSTAASLVDFEARVLTIDLQGCTRVWPSAVIMLCSLARWAELAARGTPPEIRSVRPADASVESYLLDCGFYDFVGVLGTRPAGASSTADVVKIRRENSPSAIEQREDEVRAMLGRHAALSDEEIELFDATVLTEVFNNVTEHGVSQREQGWWILAQYHPTHKIISLCIADNGIGIRHTLSTGPQGKDIRAALGRTSADDSYIRLALDQNVSGAVDANRRIKPLFRSARYERGSHRGYGLQRIRNTCRELGVPFSLVSQRGFVRLSPSGAVDRQEHCAERVFAGTLYHFVIPAQEVRNEAR